MEPHEIATIISNYDKLQKLTTLKTNFGSILISKRILSNEEWIDLNDTVLPSERCMLFYNIVMTRVGAYGALIDAFESTWQSGAAALLKSAVPLREDEREAYPWPSLKVKLNYNCDHGKIPITDKWQTLLQTSRDHCCKLTIFTLSAAVTKKRVSDLFGPGVIVEGVKVHDDNVAALCNKVKKHGTRVNKADVILLHGPTSRNNHSRMQETGREKRKLVINVEPITDEILQPTWEFKYDVFTWNDIPEKEACANNLVAFQIPSCRLGLADLNGAFGGIKTNLNQYFTKISELKKRVGAVNVPLTDEFVTFVEGRVPLICAIKAKPIKHKYISRNFHSVKYIMKPQVETEADKVLKVISGTSLAKVKTSAWGKCRNGDVEQMPVKHDLTNTSIIVLYQETTHEKQFKAICKRESKRGHSCRLVVWFHYSYDSIQECPLLVFVKAFKSGKAVQPEHVNCIDKLTITIDQDTLIDENCESDNTPVCIQGERGSGMTSLAHSLAWKTAEKKLLTCVLDVENFRQIFKSDDELSMVNFIRHFWEPCAELVTNWIENSSISTKVICHVFLDNFDELSYERLNQIVGQFKSIKLWVCGGELSSVWFGEPRASAKYYCISLLDFTDVKDLMSGLLGGKIGEEKRILRGKVDEKALRQHVRKFILNWKLITGEKDLSVLGNPRSIEEFLKLHQVRGKHFQFDYHLIGVVYHKFCISRIKNKTDLYRAITNGTQLQNGIVKYLKALYIVSPLFFEGCEAENGMTATTLRETLFLDLKQDHSVAFFLNCLIAHHGQLRYDVTTANINEFADFLTNFVSTKMNDYSTILNNCAASGLYHLTHVLVFASSCKSQKVESEFMRSQFKNKLHLTTKHGNVNVIDQLHDALEINKCAAMHEADAKNRACYCLEVIKRVNDGRSLLHASNDGFQTKNYFYASLLSYVLLNRQDNEWTFQKIRDLNNSAATFVNGIRHA